MDEDLALALRLQEQFDNESVSTVLPTSQSGPAKGKLSLVDDSWELMDPNPDIRALFLQYNDQFFWGRLAGIEVKWSPRMTLCAGLCCYEGRGGLCSVRLSLPLLKLRPRRDLVQTLLHEMIHAYLFVTDNNKDHDGHGPEFHKHMYRINKEGGVNITVYHTFHDEVAEYRQHWWRCNGPCQTRKPYFGYVKRAMNRAPGPRDPWFKDHQNSCNGTFIKIKEPEGYGKKKKKESTKPSEASRDKELKAKNKNMDIRVFIGKGNVLGGDVSKINNSSNISASPAKKDNEQSKSKLPKFYDTDSDDELPISELPTTSQRSVNLDNDNSEILSVSVRYEDALKDALSDSDDDLLCTASELIDDTTTNIPETQTFHSSSSEAQVSPADIHQSGSTEQSLPTKTNNSQPVLNKKSSPTSDVQQKLRDIWGQKFLNSNVNKNSSGKKFVSNKRPLVKPQELSVTKKVKVDTDIKNRDVISKGPIDSVKLDLTKSSSSGADMLSEDTAKSAEYDLTKHSSSRTSGSVRKVTENSGTEGQSAETHMDRPGLNIVEMDVSSCPVCNYDILTSHINQHLDMCLGTS